MILSVMYARSRGLSICYLPSACFNSASVKSPISWVSAEGAEVCTADSIRLLFSTRTGFLKIIPASGSSPRGGLRPPFIIQAGSLKSASSLNSFQKTGAKGTIKGVPKLLNEHTWARMHINPVTIPNSPKDPPKRIRKYLKTTIALYMDESIRPASPDKDAIIPSGH